MDFLPKRDADIGNWATNFATKAAANPTNYGVVAADVTPVTTALTAWNSAYAAHLAAQAAAESAKQFKDAARRDLESAIRTLARKMQASGQVSAAEAADLGLTVRDTEPTPVGAPTETPLLFLDFGNRGRIDVHVGPNPHDERRNGLPKGSVGAIIQVVEGSGPPVNESDWHWVGNVSSSPFQHNIGGTTPRTFTYRAAYVNRKNQQGPWSAPETATMTP